MNNEIIITNNTPEEISITENENQTITISSGGNVIGIVDVKVNGNSVVVGNTAYVIVPTKTSQLINDSGYITEETDPTVPSVVKNITLADINNWNSKQNALVSGNNIKTVNNNSLLGSGNINIEGTVYSAGTGINIENDIISNEITSYNDLEDLPTIPTKISDLINDSDFVENTQLSEVAYTGSYNSLSDTPIIPSATSDLTNDSDYVTSSEVSTEIQTAVSSKQDTLVSGTNIKTIKNQSILGSGDLEELDVYSTNENVIGKWIDGSTIYRQVIYVGALPDMDSLTVSNTSIPINADVIKIYGFCTKNTHSETFPIPFSWGSGTDIQNYVGLFYDYTNRRIYIRTNRYMGTYNGYVIIEYIKTS